MPCRPSLVLSLVIWGLLACATPLPVAARRRRLDEDDIKGPLAISDNEADSPSPLEEALQANLTEKKTIAQIIDAALEQEFPEEKSDAIGKNYNETAKNADVSSFLLLYCYISCGDIVFTVFEAPPTAADAVTDVSNAGAGGDGDQGQPEPKG